MSETDGQMPPAQAAQPLTWLVRGNFVNVLDRLGLSLVLSTRPNHIVFLGAADGQLTFSATPMIQPLGLAAEPGRIAVATARSIAVFANVARLAAHYPGRRDYYDAFFAPRMIHFTGDCHMHDMIFAGGTIIGANTNFSCICRVDGVHSFTPLWLPPLYHPAPRRGPLPPEWICGRGRRAALCDGDVGKRCRGGLARFARLGRYSH